MRFSCLEKSASVFSYNEVMDDATQLIIDNWNRLNTTQRRGFNVRVNGEEHSASARGGEARIHFPLDGQMMNISELAFKLVINDGIGGGNPWSDDERGINRYPTLASWFQRWPLGSVIDVDGSFGPQCVDYANAFWLSQCDRRVSTDNTGYAWGIWDARTANAGTEFDLITSWADLKPGDWVVWGSSATGHIGIVHHIDGQGVHFWSQNYRNPSDGGSPLTEDIISENNGSLWFRGAFRYKLWQ